LDFLAFLHDQGIIPSVFTKGHVLGDEELAQRHFGLSCESLIASLNDLGVSILLGFNSFDPEVQDEMVGGVKGYTLVRDRALGLLVDAGFNQYTPGKPTRMCIGTNPVTNRNIEEIFPIYTWARRRNMYVVVCPTMVSGKCRDDSWSAITPSENQLVDLYTQIYRWNLETGLQSLDQLRSEGIAAYAGGQPCNQVACGMYVTLNGTVLRCPGDDTTTFGDVRQDKLADIWHACENHRRAGTFNCGCPPKIGRSFPTCLFQQVLANLG
jgi:MoaA/NifB/PqqE/SkfB family radical SAM enzyme